MSTGKELEIGDYFEYLGVEPPSLLIYISILADPSLGVGAGLLFQDEEDKWVIQANSAGSTPLSMIGEIRGKLSLGEIRSAMRRGGWKDEVINHFSQ
ncbi:hypothetical protein KBD75_03185 [Candidatus Woesebacteria bacterium]|nr:hypothetical protein [Candidatus Woesebacteria bacterium]